MSVNREAQDICIVAAAIGQRRPLLDAGRIAMDASKLYRIAVSLRNRGVFKELVERARGLARGMGAEFVLIEDASSGVACWLDMKSAFSEDTIRLA